MRPPLAALSRIASSQPPAGPPSGPNKYLTPNNVQQQQPPQQHDPYGTMSPGDVSSSSSRMDDYSLNVPSGGGGGELTRRPSVAIGGVRSPTTMSATKMMEPDVSSSSTLSPSFQYSSMNNNNNSSSRSSGGGGNVSPLIQQPSYANNNNNLSGGPVPPLRKNSLSSGGYGGNGGYGGGGAQQQQIQSGYMDSGDEMLMMRDASGKIFCLVLFFFLAGVNYCAICWPESTMLI